MRHAACAHGCSYPQAGQKVAGSIGTITAVSPLTYGPFSDSLSRSPSSPSHSAGPPNPGEHLNWRALHDETTVNNGADERRGVPRTRSGARHGRSEDRACRCVY